MQFITTDQRISVENFEIGLIYTVTFTSGSYFLGACIGIGKDYVMFQRTAPELIFSLTMAAAADVASIEPLPAEIGQILEYTGSVPVSIKTDGSPLLDYLITGNTIQNGTPTPDNPIMPEGCGDKTENLFNYTIAQGTFAIETGNEQTSPYRVRTNMPDFKLPSGTYTINVDGADDIVIYCYDDNGYVQSASFTGWAPTPRTFTLSSSLYVRFAFRFTNNTAISPSDINRVMLNTGSTALPYEPYGYKIPILSTGQTKPVYLGEVESTRQIKKYEFTGQEDWTYSASGNKKRVFVTGFDRAQIAPALCSHFDNTDYVSYPDSGKFAVNASSTTQTMIFGITDMAITSATDWTTYLAQQYANGTPVCVWYVLATEETAVVNEPLMRIGDYADTLSYRQSGVNIPTTDGLNIFDIDTTVKPSEVYLKYFSLLL